MHDSVILAGATGLVGGSVVRQLAPARLTVIGRRALETADPAVRQIVAAPEDWAQQLRLLPAATAISALGTTLKQAGSQEAFRAIDHDLVLGFAQAALAAGARQFVLVSSVGANAASSNFYLKTKGEAEDAIIALGFDRVDIFRPGLLRGDRTGPSRPGEAIAIKLAPVTDRLTPRAFDKYRSTSVDTLAAAIVRVAGAAGSGVTIHHNRQIA